jgi:hypothetical protein
MSSPLKEYLVALGFKIDDATYKKFNAALATSAKEAAGLGSVVVGAATAIGVSVEKVAEEYRNLGFVAQRTGETVSSLKNFSYAAKQIGIDVGSSQSALESFAAAMRLNPGVKAFVQANGGTGKDTIEQLTNFVAQQKALYGESNYYVAAMKAQLAGIPEGTFLQIWNNLPKMKAAAADIKKLREEAGLAGDDVDRKAEHFAGAWDHLWETLGVGKDRIAFDLMEPTEKAVVALDDLIQRFNKADDASDGFLGKIVGITTALGGTTTALALVLRMLGLGGVAGAAVKGGGRLLLGAATNPVVAGAIAAYYGLGLDGETAGKADDEPLSKEYRAKHGGSSGSLTNGTRDQIRDAMVQYFQGQGFSRAAAIGIATNAGAESGFDPRASGDHGNSVGLFQWGPERQRTYRSAFGKELKDASPEEQMAYANWEMNSGPDAQARRAGQKLRSENDPYESGVIFSGMFERPAAGDMEAHRRGKQAANWYDSAPLVGGSGQGGGGDVTVNQTNHNHIVANNVREAGDMLDRANDRANGDLVRNTQGLTR